ncbi:hypothetical protein, partial [Actinomadura sp. KC06]|uniref:hypothetical protein n=1 Tax=Actinomadura sp. KC06 TaxID=2530369 RepID=UPI001A9E6F51
MRDNSGFGRGRGADLLNAVGNDHRGTLYPAAVMAVERLLEIARDVPGPPGAELPPGAAARPSRGPGVAAWEGLWGGGCGV